MNNRGLALYRNRWRQLYGQAQHHWRSLSLREKRLVGGMALMLFAVSIWLLSIEPALKKIAYWQAETPKLRAQGEELERLLREVASVPAGQGIERSLQQTLDASGLAGHYRLQAADASWQLTVNDAPADALVGWLLGAPRQFSLEVVEVRLQRAGGATTDDTAGTLSGTVGMDQALGAKEAL